MSADTPPVPARFAIGDRVRVLDRSTPPRHHRTPAYVQGHIGCIDKLHGRFRDPSLLAEHKPGLPKRHLYRVAFDRQAVWGPAGSDSLGGPDGDLLIDIYETWLELA